MDESKSSKPADPKHPPAGNKAQKNKPTTDKPESFLKGPIQEEQSSQGAAAQGGGGAGAPIPPTAPPELCCLGQTLLSEINCPTIHHPTCPVGQCCVGV